MKDEIREVEIVRKAAEQIVRQIDPQERTRRPERRLDGGGYEYYFVDILIKIK
jgi:hypothetical protein